MARLAPENRVMVAHAHGGGTTVMLCHSACATLCPEERATMAHGYAGGTTLALCY